MKKNLITVIILALCIVNLILNVIVIFVCMPSARKTNNLITQIAAILDLELEAGDEQPPVELENIANYNVDAQVVNLKDDGSGDSHFVQVGLTLELDKSSKEYESLNTVLQEAQGAVFDEARNIIQNYTYAEVADQTKQEEIKKEILKSLQKKYATQCIYRVSFSKFTTQ
ncbi:MAG: flagellar basal body-associated FliL family protein [Bacteroidales bacterium]|nr:flagellar basal body-associated FliL family protein [Clostridium sp.]MCM1202733.1 flagellar basal body-associated FliL family protein [Bacteroidales bacterium]